MRVALEHGAVHEGAGVALVGVAADVLLIFRAAGLRRREGPLLAGGESSAAASAQAGLADGVDDLFRGHLVEHLVKRLVAVKGDVLINVLRVNNAAVAQRHALLLAVEVHVVQGLDGVVLGHGAVVEQPLDDAALDEVFGNDLVHILDFDAAVERALGVDDDHRAGLAQAEAAGVDQLDLLGKTVLLQQLLKALDEPGRAGRRTARAAADQYLRTEKLHIALPPSISALFAAQGRPRKGAVTYPARRWYTR